MPGFNGFPCAHVLFIDSAQNIMLTGITLPYLVFVKWCKNLPADAQIIRHKLEILPSRPFKILKKTVKFDFQNLGRYLLDLDTICSDGCYIGVGYIILNVNFSSWPDKTLLTFKQTIDWDDGDCNFRQIYIQ